MDYKNIIVHSCDHQMPLNSVYLFVHAAQPLHRDLIRFEHNIRVALDQRQHRLTGTLPPIIAGSALAVEELFRGKADETPRDFRG